jgi:hypothetical protein
VDRMRRSLTHADLRASRHRSCTKLSIYAREENGDLGIGPCCWVRAYASGVLDHMWCQR